MTDCNNALQLFFNNSSECENKANRRLIALAINV